MKRLNNASEWRAGSSQNNSSQKGSRDRSGEGEMVIVSVELGTPISKIEAMLEDVVSGL